MFQPVPHLTDFESQMLDVIGHLLTEAPTVLKDGFSAAQLHLQGGLWFGSQWGGIRRPTSRWFTFPTLDPALGRLSKKGVLYRTDNTIVQALTPGRGSWLPTDLGQELMGLAPVEGSA